MKDADEAVHRVLAALNSTQASVQLEERTLRAVQDRALTRPDRQWRRPSWLAWNPGVRTAWTPVGIRVSAAVGTAMLLIATILTAHRARPHPAASIQHFPAHPSARSKARDASEGSAWEDIASRGAGAGSIPAPDRGTLTRRSFASRRSAFQPSHPPPSDEATSAPADSPDAMEALAWSEMRAASRPAPPLPLTEQEKLLQRIVHGGDPVELAELDPAVREALTAREKAEFQDFFKVTTQEPAPDNR